MGLTQLPSQTFDDSTHKLDAGDLESLQDDEFAARYKICQKLGAGAFADVLRLKDVRQKCDRALKVLRPAAAHPAGIQPEVALFREARALKHAKHKNVVELVSVLRVPRVSGTGSSLLAATAAGAGRYPGGGRGHALSPHHGSCWALLLEYMQAGSLTQLILKQMVNPRSRVYDNTAALQWAVDIAAGLAHLHSLNPMIIHRDLKLENILLQKGGADGGRRVAKLSDFGLHVMLDKPPLPFMIKAEGGCPMLIFSNSAQKQVEEQQQDAAAADSDDETLTLPEVVTIAAINTADRSGSCDCRALLGGKDQSTGCNWPAAAAAADSEKQQQQQVGDGEIKGPSAAEPPSPLPCYKSGGVAVCNRGCAKHVMFEELQGTAEGPTAHSAPLPSGLPLLEQQLQRQSLQPLTTGTFRRLSLDRQSGCGSSSSGIPLTLEAALNRPGRSGAAVAFCKAAIPAEAAAEGSAGGSGNGKGSKAGGAGVVCGSGLRRNPSAASGNAALFDDLRDILAAANAERDYQVSVPDRPESLAAARSRRASFGNYSYHSRPPSSASKPSTPTGGDAAAGMGGGGSGSGGADGGGGGSGPGSVAGSSARSVSGRSADFPTAASMLWEDMMEDVCCQEVLDGVLLSTPLAYDLTQHTGSCMYMAPEIFRGEPYNESVDIFSFGVILYELFSRTLLLYSHTPANTPGDAEAYAARVADGFRPTCPRSIPPGVWQIIQRCWDADPCARPSAAWVLQQLQQLLDVSEGAAAHASGTASAAVGGVFSKGRQLLHMHSLSFKAFGKPGTTEQRQLATTSIMEDSAALPESNMLTAAVAAGAGGDPATADAAMHAGGKAGGAGSGSFVFAKPSDGGAAAVAAGGDAASPASAAVSDSAGSQPQKQQQKEHGLLTQQHMEGMNCVSTGTQIVGGAQKQPACCVIC